jgi:5-hydroxyisourate hydrolase-like protein (transthyretin family)
MRKMRRMLPWRRIAIVSWLLVGLVCLSAGEKKKKAPEQFCRLSIVVLRESDGKPIKYASVVLHFLRKDGSQDSEGFQLKTDSDGRASIEDIPYGKLRLQVIGHGLRTYGDDIEVKAAEQEFVIRLKPPADQDSEYK